MARRIRRTRGAILGMKRQLRENLRLQKLSDVGKIRLEGNRPRVALEMMEGVLKMEISRAEKGLKPKFPLSIPI